MLSFKKYLIHSFRILKYSLMIKNLNHWRSKIKQLKLSLSINVKQKKMTCYSIEPTSMGKIFETNSIFIFQESFASISFWVEN